VLRKAGAAVVTVSEFSRTTSYAATVATGRSCMLLPTRGTIVPAGLREAIAVEENQTPVRSGDQFVLSVASLEPRKNLASADPSYASLRRAGVTRTSWCWWDGRPGLYDGIAAAARGSGFEDDIVFTGYVPDADLPAL